MFRYEVIENRSYLVHYILQNSQDIHSMNQIKQKFWFQNELFFEDCIIWITITSDKSLEWLNRHQRTSQPLYNNSVSSTAMFLDRMYFDKHIFRTRSKYGRSRCNRSSTSRFSQSAKRKNLIRRREVNRTTEQDR